MADELRDRIDQDNAELEVCTDRAQRRQLNKRVHRCKWMLRWCETRAGYVRP